MLRRSLLVCVLVRAQTCVAKPASMRALVMAAGGRAREGGKGGRVAEEDDGEEGGEEERRAKRGSARSERTRETES